MGSLCSKSAGDSKNVKSKTSISGIESSPSFAQNPLVRKPTGAVGGDINFVQDHTMITRDVGKQGISAQNASFMPLQGLHTMLLCPDTNDDKSESLLHYPSSNELLARHWVHKRGHVVRSWKRRYCVLDKTEIKYYTEQSDQPPYGKKQKGGLAMLGAICIISIADNKKTINVEIFGNIGEKDLFFYVENDEPGQHFVRMVEWAIRKVTNTMLLRNLKAGLSAERVEVRKKSEKHNCKDYQDHQDQLFKAAVQKLQEINLVQFVSFKQDGTIFLQPGLVQLWYGMRSEDKASDPTTSTESKNFGFAYQYIDQNYKKQVLDEEEMRIVTCADIADFRFEKLDATCTEWLRDKCADFHHATCTHSPYLMCMIKTFHGHTINMLACCLQDYNNWLMALQQVLLYVLKEDKVKAIVASARSEKHYDQKAFVVGAARMFVGQSNNNA
eukprot:gene30522-36885_t